MDMGLCELAGVRGRRRRMDICKGEVERGRRGEKEGGEGGQGEVEVALAGEGRDGGYRNEE